MNGHRRAIVGIALLCALLLSIATTSSASAEGTTAFTCVEEAKGDFNDEHCKEPNAGSGSWQHQSLGTVPTEVEFSNEKTASSTTASTPMQLHFTVAGVTFTIECTKVSGEGSLTNEAGPPMKVNGSGLTFTYSECTVPQPAVQGCKIEGGKIQVKGAKSTTKANSMEIEFQPEVGTLLASFKLEGCKTKALNIEYKLEGSMKAIPEGATLTFTEASTKGLKLAGSAAFLIAKKTLRMPGVGGKPITFTTTDTGEEKGQKPHFTGFNTKTNKHEATKYSGTSGAKENVTTFKGGWTIECYHSEMEATSATGLDETLEMKNINYFGNEKETASPTCVSVVKQIADVEMGGCTYIYHLESELTATVDIVCPKGKEITIKMTEPANTVVCTWTIGEQKGLRHVLISQVTKTTMTAHLNLQGVTYETKGGLTNCGTLEGVRNDGEITSNVLLTGTDKAGTNPMDISIGFPVTK